MQCVSFKHFAWVGCLAAAAAFTPNAQAASISAELTCVINGLNAQGFCTAGPSFGTVKLDDTIGGGMLTLSVNLIDNDAANDMKFKDFMLAYGHAGSGLLATEISSNPADFGLGTFSIPPYTGTFNLGAATVGKAESWSWVLTGNNPLLLSDFLGATDSLGKLSAALHIQAIGPDDCSGNDDGTTDCVPGQVGDDDGEGSLKIGGTFTPDRDIPEVPEPSTMLLLGGALLGLGLLKKKRNS